MDIIEEAKKFIQKLAAQHHVGCSHNLIFIKEQFNRLIEEVERLNLKKVTYSNLVTEHTEEIIRLNKQIESLSKSLEEANHILMDIPYNSNPDLMIREITKERDELMKNNGEITIEFCKQQDALEAENAELRNTLDEKSQSIKALFNIRDEKNEEIKGLEVENNDLQEQILRAMFSEDQHKKELCEKLAASEKKVKELELWKRGREGLSNAPF